MLPEADYLRLDEIAIDLQDVTVTITSCQTTVCCPRCGETATREHSRYVRQPGTLTPLRTPCAQQTVFAVGEATPAQEFQMYRSILSGAAAFSLRSRRMRLDRAATAPFDCVPVRRTTGTPLRVPALRFRFGIAGHPRRLIDAPTPRRDNASAASAASVQPATSMTAVRWRGAAPSLSGSRSGYDIGCSRLMPPRWGEAFTPNRKEN